MKKTSLLFTFLSFALIGYGQFADTITFEKNSNLVHIDTSQHPNIWQIGRPQKPYLDSAYSRPYAIITDTVNPYPANNISSFTVGLRVLGSANPYIKFLTKYDMDTLLDSALINVSIDTGKTWLGGVFYTGKSQGWEPHEYYLNLCNGFQAFYDTLLIRFTFKSDSVVTNKDGWMIDNIMLYQQICEGVQEVNKHSGSINIYPNPASGEVSLLYALPPSCHKAVLNLYNPVGQLIKSATIINNAGTLTEDVSGLPNGIYYYRLLIDGTAGAVSKLVIIK